MDLAQFKNNKYYLGKFDQSNQFEGWFVGSFWAMIIPVKRARSRFFIYNEHQPGDICQPHYHQQKIELLLMLDGKLVMWSMTMKLS